MLARALVRVEGDPGAALDRLAGGDAHTHRAGARRLAARLPGDGISVVALPDPAYPAQVREIPDPPPVLYVRGGLAAQDDPAAAVVGSRRASTYGQAVARYLAEDLAAGGVSVVSGLARGIDTAAHQGALLPPGGRTIAVLAHGPDRIYPPENRQLGETIVERGALLTEFPPGVPPRRGHFPRRNRLISALCRGVVVVEAARRSGSLVTARLAAEQGREVYAVPGPITSPTSRGPNDLLAAGAHPVRTALDIVSQFPAGLQARIAARLDRPCDGQPPPGLSAVEMEVWARLDPVAPIGLDALSRDTGLPAGKLVAALLGLEIRGLVRSLPGGGYRRGDWTGRGGFLY
ncbi:MAG: DNA-processing protein DprA [Acidobacteriota bacterium]